MFVKLLTPNIILLQKFKKFFFKYVLIASKMISIHSQLKKLSLEKFCMKIIRLLKKIWIGTKLLECWKLSMEFQMVFQEKKIGMLGQ